MSSYQVRKKKRDIPPWIKEHSAIILLALVAFLYLVPFKILGCFRGAPPPMIVLHPRLAIVLGPIKSWEEGGAPRIKSVSMKVKNVGEAVADGVSITGIFRGKPVRLEGKSSLFVGEVGDYSVQLPISVLGTDSMEYKLQCGGCEVVSFDATQESPPAIPTTP